MKPRHGLARNQRAFTLVELLIVILVIAILIAVAAPAFLGQEGKAHDSAAKQTVTVGAKALRGEWTAAGQGDLAETESQLANRLEDGEPQYSFHPYAAGARPSTGASDVSVSLDNPQQVTLCAKSKTRRVYCERTRLNGGLPGTNPTREQAVGGDEGAARCSLGQPGVAGGSCQGGINTWAAAPEPGEETPVVAALPPIYGHSNRDGNYDLFRFNPNDGSAVKLMGTSANEQTPALSPDGSKVAYVSNTTAGGGSDIEIWVRNADGSGTPAQLTVNTVDDGSPQWSPDGSKIVFARSGDIYAINANGTGQTRLTNTGAVEGFPFYSPDGRRIGFMSQRTSGAEIWWMEARGEIAGPPAVRVTNSARTVYGYGWTRDGAHIVAGYLNGDFAIALVPADGTGSERILYDGAGSTELNPVLSRDGSTVAFSSNVDGDFDIYTVGIDGNGFQRATNLPGNEIAWQWP